MITVGRGPMKDLKEKALRYVKMYGPVLPVNISKTIGSDILFASAVLSDLVSEKQIFLTHTNFGGSPLYYVKGQESKLEVLYNHLADKEKEAYRLLKEKKVLYDRGLEPSIRVALRQIKDFAVMLQVKIEDADEIFWKWYLTEDKEVNELVEKFVKDELIKVEKIIPIKEKIPVVKEKILAVEEKIIPVREKIPVIKEKVVPVKEKVPIVKEKVKAIKKIKESKEIKVESKKKVIEDEFLEKILKFFSENKISVISQEITRKGKEIDLVVKVPSNVGELIYYVKARNKKGVSNADLSLAFNIGQSQKLPVLFLGASDISKKTIEYIEKNFRGYLVFKKI